MRRSVRIRIWRKGTHSTNITLSVSTLNREYNKILSNGIHIVLFYRTWNRIESFYTVCILELHAMQFSSTKVYETIASSMVNTCPQYNYR